MDLGGIEPPPSRCERDILPLNYRPKVLCFARSKFCRGAEIRTRATDSRSLHTTAILRPANIKRIMSPNIFALSYRRVLFLFLIFLVLIFLPFFLNLFQKIYLIFRLLVLKILYHFF